MSSLEILKILDLIPIVFATFKALVFGAGMFFAIFTFAKCFGMDLALP